MSDNYISLKFHLRDLHVRLVRAHDAKHITKVVFSNKTILFNYVIIIIGFRVPSRHTQRVHILFEYDKQVIIHK